MAAPAAGLHSATSSPRATQSWRATKDVTIKDDLVEEVGRMVGYGSITPVAPLAPARVPPANPEREFQHRVRQMAAAQGFTEVHNYSFISEDQARTFGLPSDVEIANPIASDQNLMRASLLPGILKNVNDNLKNFDSFRLFEIGSAIYKHREVPHFAAAIYAKDDGVAVTCDTAPPYFDLNETAIGDFRTYAKLSPPLRKDSDRRAVVAAGANPSRLAALGTPLARQGSGELILLTPVADRGALAELRDAPALRYSRRQARRRSRPHVGRGGAPDG